MLDRLPLENFALTYFNEYHSLLNEKDSEVGCNDVLSTSLDIQISCAILMYKWGSELGPLDLADLFYQFIPRYLFSRAPCATLGYFFYYIMIQRKVNRVIASTLWTTLFFFFVYDVFLLLYFYILWSSTSGSI